ncbi:MAG: DUF4892 domain-containing protein [Pseudomonadales bacterium]|nr:DUF4892 domain-containing protein [Pseudomonadales bacterium]
MSLFRLLPALCCGLFITAVQAQQADVNGAADHLAIERFPGARISAYSSNEVASHTFVLGRMQRVNGRVTPGDSQRLRGRLTRITYEIPENFSAEEVYEHYRAQILAPEQPPLFSCQGRGCGSSNFWANEVFGNRVLYGPEANQFYLAAQQQGEQALFVALYVITRGNRRVYAHLELLEAQGFDADLQASPQALLNRLDRDGSVSIPQLRFDSNDELLDETGLQQAVAVLQLDNLLQVYVVAHLQGEEDLDTLLARSRKRAEIVRASLVREGIDGGRLHAAGVGPLAPACVDGACADRVELVLRRP